MCRLCYSAKMYIIFFPVKITVTLLGFLTNDKLLFFEKKRPQKKKKKRKVYTELLLTRSRLSHDIHLIGNLDLVSLM